MLDDATRRLLVATQISGQQIHLAGQLEPHQFDTVKHILTALGGAWIPRLEAVVFPDGTDPRALLDATLQHAKMPLTAYQADGFYRTPDVLAEQLCTYPYLDLRYLPDDADILEPSAGDGSLVSAILGTNPDLSVTAVEPDPGRVSVLAHHGVTVEATTFENFAAAAQQTGRQFAACVMNPPFAVPGNKSIWIDHVLLAWSLLAPGARLAAIVPAGLSFRSDRRHRELRDLAARHGGYRLLEHDAFADAGLGVQTAVMWLIRPLAEPVTEPWLFRRYTGAETPVAVRAPVLNGEAAVTMPMQIWGDPWAQAHRVLRYRAQCMRCSWLLWSFDDGDNSPLGVLGDCSAWASYHPRTYDMTGPSVGVCTGCRTRDTHPGNLAQAKTYWQPAAAPSPADADPNRADQADAPRRTATHAC